MGRCTNGKGINLNTTAIDHIGDKLIEKGKYTLTILIKRKDKDLIVDEFNIE